MGHITGREFMVRTTFVRCQRPPQSSTAKQEDEGRKKKDAVLYQKAVYKWGWEIWVTFHEMSYICENNLFCNLQAHDSPRYMSNAASSLEKAYILQSVRWNLREREICIWLKCILLFYSLLSLRVHFLRTVRTLNPRIFLNLMPLHLWVNLPWGPGLCPLRLSAPGPQSWDLLKSN